MGLVFEICETLKSKKLNISEMEPFLIMFNDLQVSAIFCSHFLDFSRDLHTVHCARKAVLKILRKGGCWKSNEQLVERRKIKVGVFTIEEIHLKNANAKQTYAFDLAMKVNLESEAYSEPSRISAMELFCENIQLLINSQPSLWENTCPSSTQPTFTCSKLRTETP